MAMGKETFKWLELVGFILLIGGTFVYNEIVILPCGFMKDNTKDERKKREAESQGLLDEDGGQPLTMGDNTNYMSSSPGALYDSNRNKRAIERNLNQRNDLIKNHQKNNMEAGGDMYINDYTSSGATTETAGFKK